MRDTLIQFMIGIVSGAVGGFLGCCLVLGYLKARLAYMKEPPP
jgi:hypothetical protein